MSPTSQPLASVEATSELAVGFDYLSPQHGVFNDGFTIFWSDPRQPDTLDCLAVAGSAGRFIDHLVRFVRIFRLTATVCHLHRYLRLFLGFSTTLRGVVWCFR